MADIGRLSSGGMRLFASSLALLNGLAVAGTAAAWPAGNLRVSTASVERARSAAVADGAGGEIVVCEEAYRGRVDLYVQRLNGSGSRLWGAGAGLPLCTASGDQRFPVIVSDGAGGAIVAWEDARGASHDVYVQRVSSTGSMQWTANGVALCTAANNQVLPAITGDGSGGAIVAWLDGRSGTQFDVFARRVTAAGTPQWTAEGVALCTASGNQSNVTVVIDGTGGAIAAWQDPRAVDADVYAQRVSNSGTVQWTANGVLLCTAAGVQDAPAAVADGSGGAFVAWRDARSGPATDVYGQHVSAGGANGWTPTGMPVCAATGDQGVPALVADGLGGVIAAWDDTRLGSLDIFAQRLTPMGSPQWPGNGWALCQAAGAQTTPRLVADGAGGAIVAWRDQRGADDDVYAQRVSGGGVSWAADGVAVCTATGNSVGLEVVPDGFGGVLATWDDLREAEDAYVARVDNTGGVPWTANGVRAILAFDQQQNVAAVADGANGAIVVWEETFRGTSDLYAQRLDPGGTRLWAADGVAVCTAVGVQAVPQAVADGAGGAIVAWQDARADLGDVYAQRLDASGALLWTGAGVALCTAANGQYQPRITGDGAQGAIVAWDDDRGATADIYARHVSSTGTPLWAADGVALCTATGTQYIGSIAMDGSGGAVACWEDRRGADADVYVRRVNSTGTPQWTANGVALCTATGDQTETRLISDLAGGAYVAWQDARTGQVMAYARRVNSAGAPQWTADGVQLSTFGSLRPYLVNDLSSGVIAAWSDVRGGSFDPYAQRLNGAGAAQWAAGGVALSSGAANQAVRAIVPDGSGGAIVAWVDDATSDEDVYTRGVSAGGVPQGAADGSPVALQPGRQTGLTMVAGSAGNAILAWQDGRSGAGWDAYAHGIGSAGNLAAPLAPRTGHAWLGAPHPNPSAASLELRLAMPAGADARAEVLDAQGRHVRRLVASGTTLRWDGRDDRGARVASGVYVVRAEAAGAVAVRRVVRIE